MPDPKSPEEIKAEKQAAAQAERDAIKVNTPKEEAEVKEEPEVKEPIEETKEEIKTKEEEIEAAEKTAEELEAEKLASKSTAEKARIQKRIDKEVAKRKTLETENAELKAQLAAKETGEGKFTEEDVEKQAEALANQTMADRDFANACSRLEKAASKLDKNFTVNIKQLGEEVGPIPGAMIGVLDDLDNGGQVLQHFTTDPDEYERLIGLTPLKMASEVTKLAEKLAKPKAKEVSRVPPPNEPLGGNARNDTPLSDKDPMDVWIKKRTKQVAERAAAKRAGMH